MPRSWLPPAAEPTWSSSWVRAMVTMADVAQHAQVSVSTVSHVLNRTRKVNVETEEAVANAVRKLGYVHNTLARALAYLTDHSVPVVLVDRMITTAFDQVGVENKRSTAQLVAHLIGHGHRRIGMISGLAGLATTVERVSGYKAALRKANIPFDANLIRSGESLSAPAQMVTQE